MTLEALCRKVGVSNVVMNYSRHVNQIKIIISINDEKYAFTGLNFIKSFFASKGMPNKMIQKICETDFEPGIPVMFVTNELQFKISVTTGKLSSGIPYINGDGLC